MLGIKPFFMVCSGVDGVYDYYYGTCRIVHYINVLYACRELKWRKKLCASNEHNTKANEKKHWTAQSPKQRNQKIFTFAQVNGVGAVYVCGT